MVNRRYARRRRQALLYTTIAAVAVVLVIIVIIFSLNNRKNNSEVNATATPDGINTVEPTATLLPTDELIPTEDPYATATLEPTVTSTIAPTPTATTSSSLNETRYVKISADSKLNVRASANTTSDIVTTLNYGEAVTVTAQSGDWYQIKTSASKTGYVMTKYLVTAAIDVSTEMKKLWDKSGIYRDNSTQTTYSKLTTSYAADYKITFKLEGVAGSATNTVSGTAYITGNMATYTKDSSKITFTIASGKITVAVTKVTTPTGISYAGTYSATTLATAAPTATPSISTPLTDKYVLFAGQEAAFKALVGTKYDTFVSRCVSFDQQVITGSYRFSVFYTAANEKAVVKVTSDGKIWAALTDANGEYTYKITNQEDYPDDFNTATSG